MPSISYIINYIIDWVTSLYIKLIFQLGEFKENTEARKRGFWIRFWGLPGFCVFYYLWLSYADFLLEFYLDWVGRQMEKVEVKIDYSWAPESFYHFAGWIISYFCYWFVTLIFVDLYRYFVMMKYILISSCLFYSINTYYRFWELFYYYTFDLEYHIFSWIIYFMWYWTGIVVQWGVEMEEEIDYADDLENERLMAQGKPPKVFKLPRGMRLWDIILALGTTGQPIETPEETKERYHLFQQRVKVGFKNAIFPLEQAHELTITHREFLRNWGWLWERILMRWEKHKYSWFFVFSWFRLFFYYFFGIIFLISDKLYLRVRAVGPYSYYNSFFNRKHKFSLFFRKNPYPNFKVTKELRSFKARKFSQLLFLDKSEIEQKLAKKKQKN